MEIFSTTKMLKTEVNKLKFIFWNLNDVVNTCTQHTISLTTKDDENRNSKSIVDCFAPAVAVFLHPPSSFLPETRERVAFHTSESTKISTDLTSNNRNNWP